MTSHFIGYVGMTHLGLNSAVAAADKGFEILCYDPDSQQVAALLRHELPILKQDFPKLLAKNAHHDRWLKSFYRVEQGE